EHAITDNRDRPVRYLMHMEYSELTTHRMRVAALTLHHDLLLSPSAIHDAGRSE
ncbi:MAG: hypothetical protein QOI79_4167, partial [Mycobacterium sp.]|nr:hypothetical protein [Mycobacterium sp.]